MATKLVKLICCDYLITGLHGEGVAIQAPAVDEQPVREPDRLAAVKDVPQILSVRPSVQEQQVRQVSDVVVLRANCLTNKECNAAKAADDIRCGWPCTSRR